MRSGPPTSQCLRFSFVLHKMHTAAANQVSTLTRLHLRTLGLLQPKPIENKEEDVSRNPSRWNKKMKWESNIRDQHLLQEQFSLNQV